MNVNQDRTETERYCINCLYNLRGLPEHRCPECGQTFDPDDTTTFLPTPDPLKRQTMLDPSVGFWWGGVSCVLLCICFALATPRRPRVEYYLLLIVTWGLTVGFSFAAVCRARSLLRRIYAWVLFVPVVGLTALIVLSMALRIIRSR